MRSPIVGLHVSVLVWLLGSSFGAAQSTDGGVEASLSIDGVTPPSAAVCAGASGSPGRLRCLVAAFYRDDPDAARDALALFDRYGIVAGVEPAHVMDGGFRGAIRLEPARPVGRDRRHLAWVLAAHDALDGELRALAARAPRPIRYAHRGIRYGFMRSVGRTTPSAYAHAARVAYNLSGSLFRGAQAVRTTIVHELFHLVDDGWSPTALGPIHARILARCGLTRGCLAPYAPTGLAVRGGTYYAFQPDNGDAVVEYAADLASRYLEDQRLALAGGRSSRWKCRTTDNEEAYRRLADDYFGGVDLTGPCPRRTRRVP